MLLIGESQKAERCGKREFWNQSNRFFGLLCISNDTSRMSIATERRADQRGGFLFPGSCQIAGEGKVNERQVQGV